MSGRSARLSEVNARSQDDLARPSIVINDRRSGAAEDQPIQADNDASDLQASGKGKEARQRSPAGTPRSGVDRKRRRKAAASPSGQERHPGANSAYRSAVGGSSSGSGPCAPLRLSDAREFPRLPPSPGRKQQTRPSHVEPVEHTDAGQCGVSAGAGASAPGARAPTGVEDGPTGEPSPGATAAAAAPESSPADATPAAAEVP